MILDGKAKDDFLEWYNDSGYFVDFDYNVILNALIIEWFDSIKCSGFKSLWSYSFGNNYDPFTDDWNNYIEQAIIKANEIYNENKIIKEN